MGSAITLHDQNKRLLRLATPLGNNVLIPLSISGSEAMSEGFWFQLDVMSGTRHDIQAKELVGMPITFCLVQEDNSLRPFNGYVTEFAVTGRAYGGQRSTYSLRVEPWLYLLDRGSDCRIFQELSVPDVLKQLFAPLGEVARFTFDLRKPHEPHRFLTQFNESTGNFMRRLLRLEGIGFLIEHEDGAHTVRFFDDPESLEDLTPTRELKLQPGNTAHDHLAHWDWHGRFATGKYVQRSYNYKTPSTLLEGQSSAPPEVMELARAPQVEHYTYTGAYTDRSGGQRHAGHVMTRSVQHQQLATGGGTYRQLQPGRHFNVVQVPAGEWVHNGADFTLTRITFEANDREGAHGYQMDFEAVPKGAMQFPEAHPTVIASLQTARVTGPQGEELFTDALGRVKVMFHWDRDDKKAGEKATCWLRVMQSFAGPGFGAHFTPRIGQEVVVAFEDGNPDRPFILGALYHSEHTPPYASHKGSRAGVRTRSTKGGGADNCNELYFEDEKGKEEVFLQAERDLKGIVKRNDTQQIGNDRAITVANNETHRIGQHLLIEAGTSLTLRVGGSEVVLTKDKIVVTAGVVDIDGGTVELN